MNKMYAVLFSLVYLISLLGCNQRQLVPPEADLNASFNECWPGTIIDIFTEGVGSDLVEVIKLEIKDHEPMCFTIIEETEYLKYYSDTGEIEEISKDDLFVGAWVEIDCESYHNSGYHPIFTITVIEPSEAVGIANDESEITEKIIRIINIRDMAKEEQLDCADALEKFYEDEVNEYYFNVIKSQHIIVTYQDGNSEDIVSALNAGRATIADLDLQGIEYHISPKSE